MTAVHVDTDDGTGRAIPALIAVPSSTFEGATIACEIGGGLAAHGRFLAGLRVPGARVPIDAFVRVAAGGDFALVDHAEPDRYLSDWGVDIVSVPVERAPAGPFVMPLAVDRDPEDRVQLDLAPLVSVSIDSRTRSLAAGPTPDAFGPVVKGRSVLTQPSVAISEALDRKVTSER